MKRRRKSSRKSGQVGMNRYSTWGYINLREEEEEEIPSRKSGQVGMNRYSTWGYINLRKDEEEGEVLKEIKTGWYE